MKNNLKYIVSYITALIFSMIGLAVYLNKPIDILFIVFAILSFVPVLLFFVSFVVSKSQVRRINQTKVADMQKNILDHRKEAAETSRKFLKKLRALRHKTTAYTIIVWLLAGCVAFFGGILYTFETWLLFPMLFYSGTIFCVVYSRIPQKDPITLYDDTIVLDHDEYPHIFDIVNRAARALDCQGEIIIILSYNCNASIVRDGNKYYIQLGSILLNILSENELYCICLHEFSHCAEKNLCIEREYLYSNWISSNKNLPGFFVFISNIFAAFDVNYLFNHMIYQYATSVAKEIEADRDMAKHGDAEAAASALLKTNYERLFQWERGVKNEPSAYISETPNHSYLNDYAEKLKEAIEKRHKDWDNMLEREILPNNATHPIFKMRLETLGVQQIKQVEDDSSAEYRKEVQSALNFADAKLYEDKATYERDRKELYLEPLQRIAEWEEKGKPIIAENYADVISDLKQIGRHEDAEALCDRAIQELDINSSQHAYYIKGCTMIHRYDKNGADYIYHAIDNNNNYLMEGLDELGTFYCMTGMEAELLDYRKRSVELAQQEKDEYREILFLSPKDNLSCDDMPASMLQEILTYIHSVDEDIIQNIYLVRKTITETFFTSAFVIHFYGGTDEQRGEIMHKIFRYLDTYPVKWQFSLFDYFDYPNIKFKKIKGSLVYSKSESKGENQ